MKEAFTKWRASNNIKWLINYHHRRVNDHINYLSTNYCRLLKAPETKQFFNEEIDRHKNEVLRLVVELENIYK